MKLNINHAWLLLGIIFILFSGPTLIFHPGINSAISVACGLLISYASIKNLGGWKIMLRNLLK